MSSEYPKIVYNGPAWAVEWTRGGTVTWMPDRETAYLCAGADRLWAALLHLVRRCDGEEGVRPDGSNIDTLAAHAALSAATPPKEPTT